MKHRMFRFVMHLFSWRYVFPEELFSVFVVVFVLAAPVAATTRFEPRGLFMNSVEPGATTSYTVSMRYITPQPVGSVDMLFCIDPIPYHPCVTPPGLDVSNAVLSNQSGETGFSILSKSANRIILTRPPSMINASQISSYKFDNIVNPTDTSKSFSIRLNSYSSTDASGIYIDFGSVKGQIASGITIETQIPPMLLFCVAEQVADLCGSTNDVYYNDMGALSAKSTLKAQSQMSVGTNASNGFAITAHGPPLTSGTNVIDQLETPSLSEQGRNQFGINLVANTNPAIGANPAGPFTNATPADEYGIPNHFTYNPGDVVAYSPNVSLMRKFTVSYIVNSKASLRPGVYNTTITFIASGQF